MNSSFENFCPRLRPGRVIPQGSRIIFETENPYNQIILPMALADLILLCSGQYSIRQIIEKIYKKQGAVPFKTILKAIHVLHQSGFFENGHELSLNNYLKSWMEPRPSHPWSLSWRFGQRIVADRRAPIVFYVLTLGLLAGSLFGMQDLPSHPLTLIYSLFSGQSPADVLFRLLICSSVLQTARHLARGIQLLLLTGKAYNVAIRLSPWGLHLHVGDEANDLFENRLYTSMFHLSQMIMGWFFLISLAPFLDESWLRALTVVNLVVSFWEMNPFVHSEGLRLIQTLTLPSDNEVISWHYDTSSLLKSMGPQFSRQDQDFARICAIWGTTWLAFAITFLSRAAALFAPALFSIMNGWNIDSAFALAGVGGWFLALYAVAQSFVETIVIGVARPWWWSLKSRLRERILSRRMQLSSAELLMQIQDLPLFSHFGEQQLMSILSKAELTEVPENALVLKPGELSKEMFVLLEGEIEIVHNLGSPREWSSVMQAISIFGESALLDESPRSIQIKTRRRSHILELPVQNIRDAAQESHAIRQLEDFRNAILVNQFFASSPAFRSLSQASIDFLCSRGALEYTDHGQVVFRQGDVGVSLYLILKGSVEVEVHGTSVARLKQGSFFGEIALIANIPRTATIRTLESSVFFKISADSFWEVLVQNLDLGVFIETISEDRLRADLELSAPLRPTGSDPQ